jgi:hypothetical protein
MEIRFDNNTAQWDFDGRHIVIEGPALRQAMFSKQLNVIITLCGEEKKPNLITCYDPHGKKLKEIKETKDCYFNYLGENRGHDVAVMTTAYIQGWHDWWYAIDIENGNLVSLGEGR